MSSCSPSSSAHANEQRIRDGDVILWFNFRADRARQLSRKHSVEPDFTGFETRGHAEARRLLHPHRIRSETYTSILA